MEIFTILITIAFFVLWIVMVVKFFQLCQDTREIKEFLYKKTIDIPSPSNKSPQIVKGVIQSDDNHNYVSFNSESELPNKVGQIVIIGSFGKCAFIDEAPKGVFNFKTEKGQNISLKSKDLLELGKI